MPKEPITESEIKGLTLLEASRLVKLLQEQLGVAASAAAPTSGREGEVPIEPASYRALSELQELATTWAADNIPTQELRQILDLAIEVFEDNGKAMRWLKEPNMQIGNRPPVSALGTTSGFQNVETVLHQIQYGVIG